MISSPSRPTGLLLANLGSPEAPTTPAVRRYLREFLLDGRVIDIPAPLRALLVGGIIAPFRAPRSAHAYATVWTPEGSPLLANSRRLARAVEAELGPQWRVALGMRYGEPSLAQALDDLVSQGCDRVRVLPLYPQYATATVGSTLAAVYRLAARSWNTPALSAVAPFHDDPRYLDAVADSGRAIVDEHRGRGHVVFSFHGLPERHLEKSRAETARLSSACAGEKFPSSAGVEPGTAECLRRDGCCDVIGPCNRFCYRAQCLATARGVAARLGLDAGEWSASFQSRLGRGTWIRPYTEEVLRELGARRAGTLVVFSPAFVADCLETLEEIGERGRRTYREAGGEDLVLVPSLNDRPGWVRLVAELARGN